MNRQSGHTLIEVSIAALLIMLLVGVAMSIATESTHMVAQADSEASAQYEANRGVRRLTEILRKSGWNSDGATTYPLVLAGGTELQFRLTQDLDGNGYPFNQTTGELEWGATVYTIRRDPASKTLYIYDPNDTPMMILSRHVEDVSLSTYLQDNTLHFREIRVTVHTQRQTPRGEPIDYTATSSIHLRN